MNKNIKGWPKYSEINDLRNQVGELKAARFAYASEFPLDADGEPDVGSVHANIRAMKRRITELESRPAAPVVAEGLDREKLSGMLNRLSLANRRDGWTTNDPWKNREDIKRAKDAVDKAETEVIKYVADLLAAHPVAGSPAEAELFPVAWELHQAGFPENEGPEVRVVFSSRMADEYIEEGWTLERTLLSDKRTKSYARGYDQPAAAEPMPASEAVKRPDMSRIMDLADTYASLNGTSRDRAALLRAIEESLAAPAAPTDAKPHWIDGPQSALGGKSAREGYAANPESAQSVRDAAQPTWTKEMLDGVAVEAAELGAKFKAQPTIAVEDRLQNVWNDALEEAALICDGVNNHDNPMTAGDCADEIRALKGRAIASTTTTKG